MEKGKKIILIIEAIVGVLILLGGIFLIATESKAPSPTPVPSASSGGTGQAPVFSTYISSPLQISLLYPYGWRIDATYNSIPGLERYQGPDGYFRVDATNDPAPRKNWIIKKYPKPIKLGATTYKYFVLEADANHLKSIGDTVIFLQ